MEPLRESPRLRGSEVLGRAGWAIVTAVFLGPLLLALLRYALQAAGEDSWGLSWVFFRVLGTSLLFTGAQAFVSAALACVLGLGLGTLLAPWPGAIGFRARRFAEAMGLVAFSLPGVAVALLVMDLNGRFGFPPANGFWAIVAAHLLFNVLYVASSFAVRARAWLASGGVESVESAALLNARGGTLLRLAFGHLWRSEARVWFPLVFLWSFSAFATLLLLGGGRASLEVLLFHSLQNDPDTGRILVLMLLQGATGMGIAAWMRRSLPARDDSPQGTGALPEGRLHWMASRGWRWAAGLALTLAVLPFAWLFAAPLAGVVARGWASLARLAPAFGATLALAGLAALFSGLFSLLIVGANSLFRHGIMMLGAVSTTLLVAAWMGSGFDLYAEGSLSLQLLAAGLGIALAHAPWVAFRTEARLRSVPRELLEAAATLGGRPAEVTRHLEWPLVSDIVSRAVLTSFVSALGEIAIAGLFLRDLEVVAVEARRLANRYDFEGASALMLFLLLATLLAVLLRSLLMRGSELEREGTT